MQVNVCNISQLAFGGGAGPGVTPQRPTQGAVPAQGNPSVTFVNAPGEQINEIYASLSAQGS